MKDRTTQPADGEELDYFDIQAAIGTTKHMGGLLSTRDLMRLSRLQPGERVLDVGSGAGASTCYLAQKAGCEVVGIDLHAGMVALGSARVTRKGLQDQVQIRQGDVTRLEFSDGSFDAVLCESVLAFVEEKQKALEECWRVLKPGGRIALNEVVWLQPPTAAQREGAGRLWGLPQGMMLAGEWERLLAAAGFQDITGEQKTLDPWRESTQVLRYSLRDITGMLRETLRRWRADPVFRAYLRARQELPRALFRSFGYGLYSGWKSAPGQTRSDPVRPGQTRTFRRQYDSRKTYQQ